MANGLQTNEMPEDFTAAFWQFKGSMEARMDNVANRLQGVESAINDDRDEDQRWRDRLTAVESKQAMVYKILGAIALLAASGAAGVLFQALWGG